MASRPALIIVSAAIAARVLMLIFVDPAAGAASGDSSYFLAVARSLVQTGAFAIDGVPSAFHPPAYPTFLALVFALGGSPATALILQSLGTIAVSLLTFVKLRSKSRPLALLAALLIATSPFIIVYEYRLLGEAIACQLLWSALLLIAFPSGRWQIILGGLLLGGAILARDTLQFLPLLLIPFAVWAYGRKATRVLVAVLIAYLVVLPWPLRNAALPNGHFALSEGRFGLNLWIGTWERDPNWLLPGLANANYPKEAFVNDQERRELLAAQRTGDDARFRQAAADRIRSDPLFVIKNWAIRYPRLWLGTRSDQVTLRPQRGSLPWTMFKAFMFSLNIATLGLGILGLFMSLRRREWAIFAAPIIYSATIYIPFHNSEPRYSVPSLTFLYLFAAIALVQWWPRVTGRLSKQRLSTDQPVDS